MKHITDTARYFILIALDCINNYCLGGDTIADIHSLKDWEKELYIEQLVSMGVVKYSGGCYGPSIVELTEQGKALVPKYFKAAKATIEEFSKGYLIVGRTGYRWFDKPAMQRIVNKYAA